MAAIDDTRVTKFGAVGDGVTDDSLAIRNAMAAAGPGGTVYFPAGEYISNRSGSSAWAFDVPFNNMTFVGAPGQTVLKMKAGQPAASVSMFRINEKNNTTFRDLVINGNWGAQVGITTTKDGINHGTNADPDSHGFFVRGVDRFTVDNCIVTQTYGDGMWFGSGGTNFTKPSKNIRITRCDFDICARSGIALGMKVDGMYVGQSRFTNIMATPFDTEPVGGGRAHYCRDITLDDCEFRGGFWNPEDPNRSVNCAIAIVGASSFFHPNTNVQKYRVTNCKIRGQILIAAAEDVVLENNEIILDFPGYSYSPILCWFYANDVQIIGNHIYDRTEPASGDRHEAAIAFQYSGSGNANWAPLNATIKGNHVHVKNGRAGIRVVGTGGGAFGSTGTLNQAGDAGTAIAVDNTYPPDSSGIAGEGFFSTSGDATSITKATAAWVPGSRVGWALRSNVTANIAIITANTDKTATFAGGWKNLDGEAVANPDYTNKSFSFLPTLTDDSKAWTPNEWPARVVVMGGKSASILTNTATKLIFDKNCGWTTLGGDQAPTPAAGAYRILPRSGVIDVVDNTIDCTDDGNGAGGVGIMLQAFRAGTRVRCKDNKIRNANGHGITIESAPNRPFEYLEVGGNKAWDDQAIPTCLSTVHFEDDTEIKKLVLGDNQAEDGVADAVTGLPGFVGDDAGAAMPVWAAQLGLLGGTYDPACLASAVVTCTAGVVQMFKVRAYGSPITSVLFQIAAPIVGGTSVLVGLYNADGTRTAEMISATVDVIASIATGGIKTIALTNPVPVTAGDDVYIAILVTGAPGTPPTLRANTGNPAINGNRTTAQGVRTGVHGSGLIALPASVVLTTVAAQSSMGWCGVQ